MHVEDGAALQGQIVLGEPNVKAAAARRPAAATQVGQAPAAQVAQAGGPIDLPRSRFIEGIGCQAIWFGVSRCCPIKETPVVWFASFLSPIR